jgi:gluconate 2-dehydrogenase subunit 3-like protein
VNRRELLRLLVAAPAAAGFAWTDAEAQQAGRLARAAQASGAPFKPKFFSAHEFRTVKMLVDLVIPADERSGSASDAGVPQFMDFMMGDQPERQVAMRGGLAWIDVECQKRFDRPFVDCLPADQTAILDDIAWPHNARAEFAHGVAFFNSFRDLTATGFWTTRTGIDDLQYVGNRAVAHWNGCPEEALKKLGVTYSTD